MMQPISSNNLYNATIGDALNVQSQWATAETQQSSGLQAENFGALGGSSSRDMLNFETDVAQAQSWAAQATTVGTTTQAMYTAVGNMTTAVNKLQVLISGAMSSPNNSTLLQQAQSIQATLLTQVNQQVDGNYLFAGSNTSVPPVNLTNYPTLSTATTPSSYDPTTPDTSYYTGDNNVLSVKVNLQETVSYGVTANNSAMEEALRAVQSVIESAQVTSLSTTTATSPSAVTSGTGGTLQVNNTTFTIPSGDSLQQIAASINSQSGSSGIAASVVPDTAGNYYLRLTSGGSMTVTDNAGLGLSSATAIPQSQLTDQLQASLTLANTANADLGNLQQSISNTSNQLNAASQQQTTFVTYLQNSLSSVKDVDAAQAASQVQQYQTQLQASYLAVASLNKLSLAQYL